MVFESKKIIVILTITILMLNVAGCVQVSTQSPDSNGEKTSNSGDLVCNKPYILVGNECCLDKDDNRICDSDETESGSEHSTNDQHETQEPSTQESGDDESTQGEEENEEPSPTDSNSDSTEEEAQFGAVKNCNSPYTETVHGCCADTDNDGACDEINEEDGTCGNQICEIGESSSCCKDCGCSGEEVCSDNECSEKTTFSAEEMGLVLEMKPMEFVGVCGDGACSSAETQESCCKDCGCPEGEFCGESGCGTLTFKPLFAPVEMITPGQVESDDLSLSSYIVVTLESIKTKKSGDKSGQWGELMFFSETSSGDETQRVKWPNSYWKATKDNMLLLGSEREAVPLFALPEEWMGDELSLTLMASDNDIGSAMPFIDESVPIEEVETYFSASTCSSKYKGLVYIPGLSETLGTGAQFIRDLIGGDDCKENDMYGKVKTTYSKSNNFGAGSEDGEIYTVEVDDMIIEYSIKRVEVPSNVEIKVVLKDITLISDGDSGSNKGEIVVHARAAENLIEGSFGTGADTLDQGIYGIDSGKLSDGAVIPINKVLYSDTTIEPFIYFEVNVFDRDDDCKNSETYSMFPCYMTNKMDEIGVLSMLYLLNDDELMKQKDQTIVLDIDETKSAIGQARITLEVTRKPY